MDKIRIDLLLDFYGALITERQRNIMELYYNYDLSLNEISENLSISRQGVFDSIKRGENMLLHYEVKLGLVKNHLLQQGLMKEIYNQLMILKQNKVIISEDLIKNSVDEIICMLDKFELK